MKSNVKSTKRNAWLVFCLLLSFSLTTKFVASKKQRKPPKFVFVNGDVIIGGFSPVHFSPIDESTLDPDDSSCQGEFNTRGYEAVEAMLFTMDMLNNGHLKDSVLPNITIGMDIKETCTTADHALRESLKFSFIRDANKQDKCSRQRGKSMSHETKTVAVVGAAYSGVSMAVTNLCGLFYVPLVSYASTSRLLSNKVQFRYFFRTVPSDMLQAQVMVDLLKAMNWNYVITLASDTEYGRSGIDAFKDAAQRLHHYHICIPVDETFTKMSDEKTFDSIFQKMMAYPKARVIILFAELQDAQILIDKMRGRKMDRKYIWIGSDAWADSKDILKSNEATLNGMFAIVPEVKKIEKFVQYFVDFNEKRRTRNPWTEEYEDIKVAHDPAFHRQTFIPYPKAPYVMDAVLAAAYALHDILGCKPYMNCRPMLYKLSAPNFQKKYVQHLEKVRFPGMSRDTMYFNDVGDAIGIYDIKHLKLLKQNHEYLKVGEWGSGNCDFDALNTSLNCLTLKKNLLDKSLTNLSKNTISSRCSQICPAGYQKITEKAFAKCCWTCKKCTGNTISNTSDSDECTKCTRGYWPNALHSKCELIQPVLIKWTDLVALIIIVSICIGLLAAFGTFLVFFFYGNTPVVKASSRELCYVLLFGIVWCYATPMLYLMEPTDIVCRIIPFATGLCPSLVVGTLLTKTNRISRILNRKLSEAGTAACLSKKWQILIVMWIALAEVLICGIYTVFSDTGRTVVTFESRNEVIIKCKPMPDIWVAIWWAYVVSLVATCTHQAFLTRKLPENYNEAKFITFTMLTTCIVVIMFIPTYFGTSGVYRTVIICFVFIIGGSAALGCIFVPKLYIILWRPEKNVPMRPKSHSVLLGTISSASFSIQVCNNELRNCDTSITANRRKKASKIKLIRDRLREDILVDDNCMQRSTSEPGNLGNQVKHRTASQTKSDSNILSAAQSNSDSNIPSRFGKTMLTTCTSAQKLTTDELDSTCAAANDDIAFEDGQSVDTEQHCACTDQNVFKREPSIEDLTGPKRKPTETDINSTWKFANKKFSYEKAVVNGNCTCTEQNVSKREPSIEDLTELKSKLSETDINSTVKGASKKFSFEKAVINGHCACMVEQNVSKKEPSVDDLTEFMGMPLETDINSTRKGATKKFSPQEAVVNGHCTCTSQTISKREPSIDGLTEGKPSETDINSTKGARKKFSSETGFFNGHCTCTEQNISKREPSMDDFTELNGKPSETNINSTRNGVTKKFSLEQAFINGLSKITSKEVNGRNGHDAALLDNYKLLYGKIQH